MHRSHVIIVPAIIAGIALAQHQDTGERLAEQHIEHMTSPDAMARWQESMTPGLAHEFLAERLTGTFSIETEVIGGGPNATTAWTCEGTAIMCGRFVEQRSAGPMLGMDVESTMLFGYDNTRKLFHVTIFDTMNTAPRTLWGNLDQDGDALTLVGTMDQPMSGEIGKPYAMTWTFHDDGSHIYEVNEILYGEPFVVVRGTATPKE